MKYLAILIALFTLLTGSASAQDTKIHFGPNNLPLAPTAPVAYFGWQGIGATLPSGLTCAQEIAYSPGTFPGNVPMNATVPTNAEMGNFSANPRGLTTYEASGADYGLVAGNYASLLAVTPSTDMIIRWAACKWGIDEDTLRAEAWTDSNWRNDAVGAFAVGSGPCSASGLSPSIFDVEIDFSNGSQVRYPGGCWTKYDIVQENVTGYTTAYPTITQSTAFALDLRGAAVRACINGDQTGYFQTQGTCTTQQSPHGVCTEWQGTPSSTQILDMQQGCIATHLGGDWWGTQSVGYWSTINGFISSKPWLAGGAR